MGNSSFCDLNLKRLSSNRKKKLSASLFLLLWLWPAVPPNISLLIPLRYRLPRLSSLLPGTLLPPATKLPPSTRSPDLPNTLSPQLPSNNMPLWLLLDFTRMEKPGLRQNLTFMKISLPKLMFTSNPQMCLTLPHPQHPLQPPSNNMPQSNKLPPLTTTPLPTPMPLLHPLHPSRLDVSTGRALLLNADIKDEALYFLY